MNGEYFKTDSKCARGCRGGIDRISELPDEIIIVMLSFLSIKEVVSTSILSSRWSNLWKSTPNLNFNTKLLNIKPSLQYWELESSWDVEKCKYIQMVNSVLKSHKALCLKEFKISLYVNKSAQSTVTKWLEFLFSRQVETLELDFLCRDERHMVALEDLLRDSNISRPQNAVVFFESLKRLCLKCFTVSGEAIDLFLRNCPLLKRLSIQNSRLTSDVVVCGTTLVLEHLDIVSCNWRGKNEYIKVSAPKLTWLRVDSTSDKLLLENLPNLIEADFTCRGESVDDAKRFASAVFSCISRPKFLHLNLLYPKVFLANDIPQMPNLNLLTVTYFGVYNHGLLPITALIWASPRLVEFRLKFMNFNRDPTRWREGLTNVTRHPHQHLKVFKFEGFCVDADDHIALVTYILHNCAALKKIMISCYPFNYAYQTYSERIAKAKCDRIRAKQLFQENVPNNIKLIVSSRPYLL